MQVKKKTETLLDTRAAYEAPQVVCFQMETEGIMSGSVTFDGGTSHDVESQPIEPFNGISLYSTSHSVGMMQKQEF